MDNEPIDTIDLSAKYVRVNNISINGDISNEQLYLLDASMIQIFNQAFDDDQSFCNLDVVCDLSLAGTFYGPETLIIDPYSYGDNSGTVVIKGNLQVLGDHTFINSQTIEVSDNIIRMHANYNSLDFGGIEVVDDSGVVRQFLWSNIEDRWILQDPLFLNDDLDVSNNVNISGDLVVDGNFDLSGRVDVDDDASFNGNVDISNHLTVEGDASFNGDVDISGVLKANNISLADILKGIGRFILLDACGNLVDSSFISFDGSSVIIDTSAGIKIPAGTTDERPYPPLQGHIRYNSTLDSFEGYDGANWGKLGGLKDVDGDTFISVESSSGADNDDLDFYTAGVRYLQIDNSGNILIGVGDNLSKFTISGETGDTQIAGTVEISGNPGGVGLTVHNDISTNNIYMHQFIYGNQVMYIDPVHPSADNSGLLVIRADLQVLGTQTTINSTTTEVSHNIIVHIPAALSEGGLKVKDQNDHLRPFVFKNAPDYRWDLSDAIIFRDDASFSNNVDISENLYVNGDVSFQRNLDVSGRITTTNFTVLGDVSFNGNVDISDRLVTYGDVSLNSEVDISGRLNVFDTGTFLGNGQGLVVVNDSSMNGDLYLGGILYTENNFIIDPKGHGDNTGLVIIKGGLQVDGSSTTINSTILDISDHRILLSSNSTHQSQTDGAGIEVSNNKLFIYDYANDRWLTNIGLNVSGDLIVEEDTSLNNAVDISGKFNINGDTSFNAPIDITGKFNVTGDSSFNGDVDISDNLYVNGDVSFQRNLDVSGQLTATSLKVLGDVSFDGFVDISENLYVNGDVSFQRNLDVSGTLMATTIKVLGDVSFDGFVDISDRLVVNGDASFNQDVEIAGSLNTGATDISDTLNVDGDVSLNSSVDISDQLNVNGDVSLNSNVDISDQLSVNGDVSLNGNVDISEQLIVNGDVSLNSNVDISDNLVVNGDASFNSDVEISGILYVNDMVVDGDVSFNSNVDISDRLLVNGDVSLNSNVDISDSLVVNGDASFNSDVGVDGILDVSDGLNVDGDVSLNSSVTISDELIVNGDVSLNSNVDISENLYVNGDVSFQRNLDVSGQIIATSIKVLGDVSFNGNVDISDRLVVNGDISLNSNVDISDSLVVNGDASFNSNVGVDGILDVSDGLNVDGDVSLNSSVTISDELIVNGDVSLNSNVDISENLYVNGDVSFQRNLDVSGKLIVTTLEVLGDVSFNGNVDISDRLVVYGDVSFQGHVDISKNLTVSGETILSTLRVNDLSNNRVVIVGPSGELEDDGNFTFDGSNLVIDTSQAIQIPVGTTDERPGAVTGQIRFNVTDNRYEGYNGNAWVPLGDTGNNLIVATGSGTNALNWSNDHGETWNAVTDSTTLFNQAEDVAWNGRRWVAVGEGASQIAYSDDGIIWYDASNTSSLFNAQADGIGANNYLWVAGGSFQANNIIYSSDGIYWQYANNSPFGLICNDVKYGGNIWVAAGGYAVTSPNNVLGYSYNGRDWFGGAGGEIFATQANGIAWNGELWVAVGGGATTPFTIAYSYDGKNWNGVAGSTSLVEIGQSVAWNGSLFVIVGESSAGAPNTILTSQDGINWIGRGKTVFGTGVTIGRGRGITWSGSNWIAVGFNAGSPSNTIATSLDGITWVGKGSTNFSTRGTGVAVNNLFDYNRYQLETLDISYRNVDISLNLLVEGRVDISGDVSLNNNVDISENLYVNGDVSFQRNLDVSGTITATTIKVLGDVSFDGFVDISDRLVVYGDASFNQDVEIAGTLNVDGDVSLNADVDISGQLNANGDVSLNSKVDISDQLNVNGDVSLNSNVDISENLYVNGDVSFQRNLDVSGQLTVTTLKVLGDVSFDGFVDISDRLVAYGDASFNQDVDICGILHGNELIINSDASFNNNVTISNELIVNGDVSLNSNVDISENLYVNGDVSFQRNLDVSGLLIVTTLKVLGDVSFNGNVDVSDRLVAYGDASFNQDVDICGTLHGYKLIMNDDASFNSNVDISEQLIVNGDVSLNSNVDISENLYVNGDVSFQRNLDVSGQIVATSLKVLGDVSFNGNVDISDRLVVYGDSSLNGNVDISNRLVTYGDVSLNSNVTITDKLDVDGDASFNKNVDISMNLTVSGDTILSTARVNDLTETRIVFVGPSGELIDSSFLTFDGSNLIIDTSSSIQIPVGTTDERPNPAEQGQIRYNITDSTFEGYDGNNWGSLGGVKDVDGDTYILAESSPGADNDELEFFTAGTKYLSIDGCGNIIVGSNMFTISAETGYTSIAGDVSLNNNVDISENLYVNGDVSFQRNLDVSGQIVASSLKVLGDVSFNGNVDISDRLVVYGDVSLNGNVDISDRLVTYGDVSLNSIVTITGKLDVNGDASFNSNVDISNRLNVNDIAFDGLRKDINVLNGENNLLVAVGSDNTTGDSNRIIYSHDLGDTWFNVASSSSIFTETNVAGTGVAYNGSLWVASGRGGNNVAYSYDGINWNAGGTVSTHSGRDVIYDSYRGKWILALQGSTTLAYSYDGINWVSLGNSSISAKVMGIDVNSSLYVATGEGTNTLVYSYDLVNWNAVSTNPFQRGRCVLWTGRRWLAGGSIGSGLSSIVYSDDGINWIDASNANNLAQGSTSVFSTVVNKIASNGSTIVAVGKGGNTIAYSKDHGESFTGLGISYLTVEGFAVEWCGTHFIAGGTGNQMFKSTDGINWTAIATPVLLSTNDITWNKSIYGTLTEIVERLTTLEDKIDVSYRNVDISLDLLVEGDASFNNKVDISNHLQVLGDASFNNKVDISNHLQVLGDASFNGLVDISENLYVNGDVSFQRNLDVSGLLTTTDLVVLQDSSFNGFVDISENLYVNGDVSFQRNLDVSGNVNVGENLIVDGTSILRGGVTLESTLDVSSTATFVGSGKGVIIENDLSVNNHIYMGSHLYGPPILYIDPVHHTADNSGLLVIRADLQVLGTQTTINSVTTEVSSNIIVHIPSALTEGGLQVKDENDVLHGFVFKNSPDFKWDLSDSILFRSDASFNEDVDICGTLHVNDMIVNGDVSFLGFVDISENLYVNGDVSFQRNLDVSGQIRANDVSCDEFNATRIKVEDERVAIGLNAGFISQGTDAIGIGHLAGQNTQGFYAISLGEQAGQLRQGNNSIGIGRFAAQTDQLENSIAIGRFAGRNNQNSEAIAIGYDAGSDDQSSNSIAIGNQAGSNNQGTDAIAIGRLSGLTNQGTNAIAIGAIANVIDQKENTIILSAAAIHNPTDFSNALYINPIRNADNSFLLQYNTSTKEITHSRTLNIDKLDVRDISVVNLDVSYRLLVEGDASFNKKVDISDQLEVLGDASFNNRVDIGNHLQVLGDASFNNKVDISDNLYVNGDVSFQRNLDVSGQITATSIKVLGDVSFDGFVDISDRLVAYGDASFNQDVDICGILHGYKLIINDDASFNSKVDISDNLYVNGDVSFQRNLDVSGKLFATTFEGLDVSFRHLDLSGRLTVEGNSFTGLRENATQLNNLDNLIVAVGDVGSGTIAYSRDNGESWATVTGSDSIFSLWGFTIGYNGSMWVAGGRGTHNVAYSYDGISWFGGGTPFTHSARNIKYNSYLGHWIAGGEGGEEFEFSYDGINWSPGPQGDIADIGSVRGYNFNENRHVITSTGTYSVMYSDDFITWNPGNSNTSFFTSGRDVIYTGRRWLVSGSLGTGSGTIFYSDDGVNWTDISNASNVTQNSANVFSTTCNKMAFNGNMIVAVGSGTSQIAYSTDHGLSFTGIVIDGFTTGFTVEWCGTRWIVGGDTVQILLSDDGINWTQVVNPPFNAVCYAIKWNRSVYGTFTNISDKLTDLDNRIDVSYRNVDISLNLLVEGDSSFISNVDICGTLKVKELNVSHDSSLNGNVDISENLYVNGDVSFQRNLDVSGVLTATSLRVLGDVSFDGFVDISENLYVNGDVSFQRALDVSGLFTGADVSCDDFRATRFKAITNGAISIGPLAGGSALASIAIGTSAGINSAQQAIAIGQQAGETSQGLFGLAVGAEAGKTSQGVRSVAIGTGAGQTSQGTNSVALGSLAGTSSLGDHSVAIGYMAEFSSSNNTTNSITLNATGTTLNSDVSNGFFVKPIRNVDNSFLLQYNETSSEITYSSNLNGLLGLNDLSDAIFDMNVQSLKIGDISNTTLSNAFYNTFTGFASGNDILTGERNSGYGYESLFNITNGSFNTAYGSGSLKYMTTVDSNTAVGHNALKGSSTSGMTGNYNTAIGKNSMPVNETGNSNVAVGIKSLFRNTDGSNNVVLGGNSMPNNSTGSYNIGIGTNAGRTATTGNYNIFIGFDTVGSANSNSNEIVIGSQSDGNTANINRGHGSNTTTLGNKQTTNTIIYGLVEISNLLVEGDSSFNGFVDISDDLYVNGDVSFQRNLDVSGKLFSTTFEAMDVSFRNVDISNKLIVQGDADFNGYTRLYNYVEASNLLVGAVVNSDGFAGIKHKDVGSNLGYALIQSSDGKTIINSVSPQNIEFRTSAALMAIFKNSNFGIGTNNPTSLLTISGDSSFNGDVDIKDNLHVLGDVSFQNNLDVSKNLYVNGDVSFQRSLDVSNHMVVNGTRFSSIKHTSDIVDCKTNFMVAIGGSSSEANNKLAYSYDGITWTGVFGSTSLFTSFGQSVATNGTTWVAVGNGTNTYAYSYDGITWTGLGTVIDPYGINRAFSVKWINELGKYFMGVHGGTQFAYSYDGINWGWQAASGPIGTKMTDFDYNYNRFVAVGEGTNTMAYSDDGITWTSLGQPLSRGISVTSNDKIWVATGQKDSLISTIVYSEDNGVTWFDASNASDLTQGSGTIFTTRANQAAWNGDMWVVVGGGTNSIAHSNDGKNWTGLGIIMFGEGKGVSWTGSKWVALGSVNRIGYSYDGINWIAVSNSTDIFSSYGSRLGWKKNVYASLGEINSRINDISSSLAGGSYALQTDFEDLSQTVLDLSTNYYEFKSDLIDVSNRVQDLSENLLKRYEDASFGTVEIRDNLILTDLSLTNLDVSNKLLVAPTTDISAVIGRAQIGQVGFAGWAGFKNENLIENNQYALLQSSAGKTLLNADADQDLRLRLDNLDYVTLKSTMITIGRLSTTNYNVVLNADVSMVTNASVEGDFSVNRIESDLIAKTDNTYSLGSITNEWKDLFVGGGSIYMDKTRIIHRNSADTLIIDNSSLSIDFSDILHVNFRPDVSFNGIVEVSGSLIANNIVVDNLDILDISFRNVDISNRLFVEGDVSFIAAFDSLAIKAAYDTNTTSYFGRAAIGYTGNNDWASFSHLDKNNSDSYALMQNSDGRTILNAASGEVINFKIDNKFKMILDSTGNLGIGEGFNNPTSLLHVSGGGVIAEEDSSFNKNLMISGEIITSAGYGGISGEILTSTGSGWKWNTLMLNDLSDAIVDITDFSNSIKLGSNKTGILNNAYGNTLIGWESGNSITSAFNNTALGFQTLNALAGGDANVAIGNGALRKLVSGDANVAIGNNSMQNNLNGGYNTAFGSGSLAGLTRGDNNIGFGRNSGQGIETGNNNMFFGYQAIPGVDISDSENQIVIGYDISGKGSNTVLLGNNNTTDTYLKGRVDITDICGAVVVHDLTTVNDTSTKIATTGAIRRYIKTALPIYNTGSITTDQKLNSKLALSFPRDNRIVIKESDIYSDLDYKTSGAQEFTFGQSCDDLYVTVGAGSAGQIAYSYDGYSWTMSPDTTLFSARGYGVDYNGLLYVAVGQGSEHSIIVSLNGINWEGYGKTIFTTRGYVVRYENNIWVAAGEGTNTLAYSFNGQTWEICANSAGGLASTIFDTNCRGIAYNGLIWVAIGSGTSHTLAYSHDGITWTGLGKTAISSNGFCVESNGEVFLAGGQGGNKLVRSNNGVNWTAVNVGMTIKVQSIACNGKTWVIGGNGVNFLAYSVDNGYTFTTITQTIFNGFINGLYWSGRHFFASGEGTNTMGISRDGINWKVLSGTPFDSKGGGVVLNNRKRNVIKFEKKMSVLCGEGTNTLAYETLTYDISNIGITYTGISGSTDIFSTRARGVAHDGKMWVAAGLGTDYSLAYSDNGTTWHGIPHSKTRLFTLGAEGIAYNGSMWVAVGQNDTGGDTSNVTIAYSYDGLCWIPVIDSMSLVNQGFCVVWGEDIWLVGGYANSVMAYSYDGKTWAGVPDKQIDTNVQDIAWNGKNFIAVGNGSSNTIAISSDGLNWRGCANNLFTNVGRGIAWSEKLKLWVSVGNGANTIGYSYNGINWVGLGTSIFSTLGRGVYYNGVRFVAAGQGTNNVAYSDDGINWTGVTGSTSLFTTEGWDGGTTNQYGCVNIVNPIVAVGEDGDQSSIAYSLDGYNWSVIGKHIFETNGWYVAYNGSIWVAVGEGNEDTIAYSYDGMNWIELGKTIFTTRGLGLGWNGSYWIAGGRGTNELAISYDGITWTGVSQTVFTTQVRKLCWTGTQWIAIGEGTNRIGTSPDGINWTARGNGVFNTGGAIDVASNGLIHVGVGDGASHRISYSYDGITWNAAQTSDGSSTSTLFTTDVYAIATNGKMWVVAGRGNNTMGYSYDGITWHGAGQPIAQRGYGVCWNGRYWVAVGRGAPKVVISYDGINWLAMPNTGSIPFVLQGLGVNSLVRVINEGGYNKEFVLGKYGHGLSNTMVVHGPRYYADYETEGYNSFNLTVRGVKDDE